MRFYHLVIILLNVKVVPLLLVSDRVKVENEKEGPALDYKLFVVYLVRNGFFHELLLFSDVNQLFSQRNLYL
jgi:hypothetical protein